MLSVAGKRAVITGGSRGIGLAIAKRFADEGAACILIGRHEKSLVSAVETLPKVALPHSFIQGDVQKADTWEGLVAQHNKIDILVNAAGRSQETLLFKTGYDDISDILTSNLSGTAFGCKAVGRLMIKQKTGCIINVSSLMATKGGKGASVYAASKAGLLGLTQALALELGRLGIRVNALVPGYIQTEMIQNMNKDKLSENIPLGRLGTPEEVADAAAFLAKNPYANNCILNLDGGLSAA